MKKVLLAFASLLLIGCAVSSPQKESFYTGENVSRVLVIPKSGIVIREELKAEIEKSEVASKLATALVELAKIKDALALQSALESTEKIELVEVYKPKSEIIENYDFIVEATGRSIPELSPTNCEFSYFISAFTLGIVPAVCSRHYLYSANIVKGEQREPVEYEYTSTTVTGWFAYILRNFDGWGEYYDKSITEANFGQRLIKIAQADKP